MGLVWSNLLVEKLYKSHHNKLLFQETDEKFMFQTATIIINEIWPISRIISQGSSSSLEAQVPTWLYVQFHESHNCNTDLILSIDRVISKASNKTLSACINGQKTKLAVQGAEFDAPGGPWNRTMRALREEVWVWIVSVIGDLYPKEYKNVREIIIRFEKGCEGNLFCFITTFTVIRDSYVS